MENEKEILNVLKSIDERLKHIGEKEYSEMLVNSINKALNGSKYKPLVSGNELYQAISKTIRSEDFQKWWDETIGERTDEGMVKTSLADYQKMGIKMTPQQYEKLEAINTCMRNEEFRAIPAHLVLMLLKAFDLI